jgi:hypothetical protein
LDAGLRRPLRQNGAKRRLHSLLGHSTGMTLRCKSLTRSRESGLPRTT